ncbi:MAG TPA: GDP-fucose synthetase [Oxalobacteraceae bacterium]|nr:GDP-fucose synthetase [Oxalobacteraceae bacterium]
MYNKRILLTGASGMVGRNVCEHLSASSYELLTPSSRDLNLLDSQAVTNYINQYKPDMIIHAAGRVGGIQANMREPVRFLLENLDMGRNVVWSARQAGVRQLINLGSSCMYPRNALNPLAEEMVLQGELEPTNEGYAIAKVTVARLCEYITREASEFQYKTLIPCNIYGRHDKFDPKHSHMVPAIIHKLHVAKTNNVPEVDIWGDGTARREFMYAGDLADCIWRCVENFDTAPALMNVGLGTDWAVNEYYQIAAEVVGFKGRFQHDLSKPVGMKQKLVSTSRANAWGWASKTVLREGLEKIYKFYLEENNK